MTIPAMPNGLYRASETRPLTSMFTKARAVVAQGCWSEKKVRENSRLMPWKGSEIDHQTMAVLTSSVASASNSPRW
jgi:hypothetical protein